MFFRLILRELSLVVKNRLDDCAYSASSTLEFSNRTANHGLDSFAFTQGLDAKTGFSTDRWTTDSRSMIILRYMNLLDHSTLPTIKKG